MVTLVTRMALGGMHISAKAGPLIPTVKQTPDKASPTDTGYRSAST